jgi:hypothetical protein
MTEQVPPTDKTDGLSDSQTAAAPNSAMSDSGDQAWSYDEAGGGGQPPVERQSWRETRRIAGLLVMGGLGLAAAILIAAWVLSPTNKTAEPVPATPKESTAPAATTSAKTSTPPASPTSIASTPDQDNSYIQALNKQGISFANPDAAVHNGKVVCENISLGMTVQQVIAAFQASNPGLANDANAYVSISVHAYCPQYGNQVSPAP